MPTIATQIWKGSRFAVERAESETHGTVFRFSGPFTARDMYNSLSPDALRNILESIPGDGKPPAHILDLTEVPYMDSMGLGMLTFAGAFTTFTYLRPFLVTYTRVSL